MLMIFDATPHFSAIRFFDYLRWFSIFRRLMLSALPDFRHRHATMIFTFLPCLRLAKIDTRAFRCLMPLLLCYDACCLRWRAATIDVASRFAMPPFYFCRHAAPAMPRYAVMIAYATLFLMLPC